MAHCLDVDCNAAHMLDFVALEHGKGYMIVARRLYMVAEKSLESHCEQQMCMGV